MKNIKNFQEENPHPVIITTAHYNILRTLMGKVERSQDSILLGEELERAIIVKEDAFPPHTIGIGSKVTVLDAISNQEKTFSLVMPAQADIRKGKISILTPMAIALMGFRENESVSCQLPGGIKQFQIRTVINNFKIV